MTSPAMRHKDYTPSLAPTINFSAARMRAASNAADPQPNVPAAGDLFSSKPAVTSFGVAPKVRARGGVDPAECLTSLFVRGCAVVLGCCSESEGDESAYWLMHQHVPAKQDAQPQCLPVNNGCVFAHHLTALWASLTCWLAIPIRSLCILRPMHVPASPMFPMPVQMSAAGLEAFGELPAWNFERPHLTGLDLIHAAQAGTAAAATPGAQVITKPKQFVT